MTEPAVVCELCGRRFVYFTYLITPDEGEAVLCQQENPYNKNDPRPCCNKQCAHGSPPCRPCIQKQRESKDSELNFPSE
jgi:hypothetical protein